MFVEPISGEQRREVEHATEAYICLAEMIFQRTIDRVPVLFDLRGQTAGMFKTIGEERMLRYNPWIFGKYFTLNLRDTVPHEVAHLVVHDVYGDRRIKPHGPQWLDVMAHFGADPGVTFDLDLEGVPQRRQRTHRYLCSCQVHEVSSTRHNRARRGRIEYHCCNCGGALVYTPEVSEAV